jgi:hypothetical protein
MLDRSEEIEQAYTEDGSAISAMTGRVLNVSETRFLVGSDLSKKERDKAVLELWQVVNGKGHCRRKGVVWITSSVAVHACLWSKHDLGTNCGSLIGPRGDAEIRKEYAGWG